MVTFSTTRAQAVYNYTIRLPGDERTKRGTMNPCIFLTERIGVWQLSSTDSERALTKWETRWGWHNLSSKHKTRWAIPNRWCTTQRISTWQTRTPHRRPPHITNPTDHPHSTRLIISTASYICWSTSSSSSSFGLSVVHLRRHTLALCNS